jgi:hypothetical protein
MGELFELARRPACDGSEGMAGNIRPVDNFHDEWSADETRNRHHTDFLVRN